MVGAIGMARLLAVFLIALPLCAIGAGSFAQEGRLLAPTGPSIGAPAKAHAGKSSHKSGAAAERTAQPNAEEPDKAARLAEGRKKFFEQSMGFDNPRTGPVTLGGDNGLTPAVGLKF